MAGARVLADRGQLRRRARRRARAGRRAGRRRTLVNSVNPHRIAGQKTAAFEVCEDLGGAPDYLAIPVGNAGNITAYWQGFSDYRDAGLVETRPVMLGFQAAGAAPLVSGQPVDDPHTVASAIRIGHPASAEGALRARDESGGVIEAVTDDEILAAYRDLAGRRASSASRRRRRRVAGVRKMAAAGRLDPGATIVCVLTGHGLKDPDTAALSVSAARCCRADAASSCARCSAGDGQAAHSRSGSHRRGAGEQRQPGAGFRRLALALELHLRVTIKPLDAGAEQLTVEGEGADEIGLDAGNRFLIGLEHGLQEFGLEPPVMRIQMDNEIPLARGLGSSAAACVAGCWRPRRWPVPSWAWSASTASRPRSTAIPTTLRRPSTAAW